VTTKTPRLTIPFLDAVVSAERPPLQTALLLRQRADALKIRLDPAIYTDHFEGTACLIGTLALETFAEVNALDLLNGELIELFEAETIAAYDRQNDHDAPPSMVQCDLYAFIMDATQQVNYATLEELERGFESNGVNYQSKAGDPYYDRLAYDDRVLELRGFGQQALDRMSFDSRVELYDDTAPDNFSASQQRMWASEPYAFKVGYLLRLLAAGVIDGEGNAHVDES
jgi:hypothetical protein